MASRLSLGREVLPKCFEAFIATEQSGEDGGIRQQDVSSAIRYGWHPQKHVEFPVSRINKRMRLRHIHGLPRQQMDDLRVVWSDGVVRQVHVEIERLDALKPSPCIQ